MSDIPNPGSDEAIKRGCLCPVYDNAKGRGWLCSGTFWINGKCPLHAEKKEEQVK